MWLFTKHGFYSAVCARQGDGKSHRPVDPEAIMVRARAEAHLKALIERFPAELAAVEIRIFEGTDYAFRIFLSKTIWAKIVGELALELDYDNFKDHVGEFQGPAGKGYKKALSDVWNVMYDYQEKAKK